MTSHRQRWIHNEAGVALVTVLLVAATLTAVVSTAAFTTIRELRASTQDQRSSKALASAEAGVDRMMNYLRTGKLNWSDIALAGCPAAGRYSGEADHPAITLPGGINGSVGSGSFTVRFEVFNPKVTDPARRFAPGACTDSAYPRYWKSPKLPPSWWSGSAQYFAIVSTGASASSAAPCPALVGGACRTVHQVMEVKGIGLPVGIYAKTSVDLNGTPIMDRISLLTPGTVVGREKAGFRGLDPYYFVGDFPDWDAMPGTTRALPVPAAVHAGGSIALKSVATSNTLEHPTSRFLTGSASFLNCTANDLRGTLKQSQWDQSGPGYGGAISSNESCGWISPEGGPPSTPPPTSLMSDFSRVAPTPELTAEDYAALKATAQSEGLWCSFAATTTCRRRGSPWTFNGTVQDTDISNASPAIPNVFVAYFEYNALSSGNVVKWRAPWGPCTDNAATSKQVIIIVRRGHLELSGTGVIHGAAIVPEGDVEEAGTATFEGTIIAQNFRNRGTSTFKLSDCAIRNLPSPWIDFTPASWSEIDR